MQVLKLTRFPVKSLGGESVESLQIEPWGPEGDRRWAVVNLDGRLQTARTIAQMLTLDASAGPDGSITIRDGARAASLEVAAPVDGPTVEVSISRQPTAIDAGDEAARFFSEALAKEVRLVWQPEPTSRSVNPDNGGLAGETLSLADAGPLLLTTQRSLEQLQTWIGDQPSIEMDRFRPNVVIDGDVPFAEDGWDTVTIGGVDFRVQQRCDRCIITTLDPTTGDRTGTEPLATLRQHRFVDRKMLFGVRLVPLGTGTLTLGDEVQPLP